MPETIDLVIPNHVEFNLRNRLLNFDPGAERELVDHGTMLADQCVFWSAANRVLLLPAGYSRQWLTDVHTWLGLTVPTVVSPAALTGRLVHDLLQDDRALAALNAATTGYRVVRFLSWGASAELYSLAAALRSWGREVELDVSGQPHYWSSEYLESKLSCADLASHIPGLRIPRGLSVASWDQLSGALAAILDSNGRAVVKSMYGLSGYGSAVVRREANGTAKFWQALRREPFFGSFPLSVQDYIEHTGECPAVDVFVDDDIAPRLVCSSLNVEGLHCHGITLGPGVLKPDVEDRLRALGSSVHAFAQSLGFRGWFSIDCILSVEDELYVTEVNARRTGAMHAIALAERWSDEQPAIYTHDALPLRLTCVASYEEHVRPVFEELWARGVRAYPSTIRGLDRPRPTVGVIVCAETAAEAARIGDAACGAVNAAIAGALSGPTVPTTGGRS